MLYILVHLEVHREELVLVWVFRPKRELILLQFQFHELVCLRLADIHQSCLILYRIQTDGKVGVLGVRMRWELAAHNARAFDNGICSVKLRPKFVVIEEDRHLSDGDVLFGLLKHGFQLIRIVQIIDQACLYVFIELSFNFWYTGSHYNRELSRVTQIPLPINSHIRRIAQLVRLQKTEELFLFLHESQLFFLPRNYRMK